MPKKEHDFCIGLSRDVAIDILIWLEMSKAEKGPLGLLRKQLETLVVQSAKRGSRRTQCQKK